jgi:NADH-dependent peroxiredoxin subunit F
MKDLLIIGGGPAGIAAGVYASRKRLTTTLVAEEIGGQSTVSEGVENWIGTVKISGADLAKALRGHLEAYKGDLLELVEGTRVESLTKTPEGFSVTTTAGNTYEGKAVLIASGAARKKLLVPGAEEFDNKGLTYCASCDGPLYADLDVAVVGGGNAGLETAIQLLAYCKSVTLIHRHDMLKGDAITVEKLSHNPKFKTICNSEPSEVHGDKFVTGLSVKDRTSGEVTKLDVEGVFVEIGVMPNTTFAKGVVELDEVGRVVTNPRDQKTSVEGVWAAGDCTDELYHQNNIAAGDAVKALEDIYQWIKSR